MIFDKDRSGRTLDVRNILVLLLLIAPVLFSGTLLVHPAKASGTLYIDPPTISVQPSGTIITYQVKVQNMDPFNGWDIEVKTNRDLSTGQPIIDPISVSVSGNVLGTPFGGELVNCVDSGANNPVNSPGNIGCSVTDGPGIAHSAADFQNIPSSSVTGLLFTVTYRVEIGNYSPVNLINDLLVNGTTGKSVSHTDSNGSYGTVPGKLPVAIFTYTPSKVQGLQPIYVNASQSYDANPSPHHIMNYTWDFGDHSQPVTMTTPYADHTYATAGGFPNVGNFTIVLTVEDDLGLSNSTSHLVQVTQTGGNTGDFSLSTNPTDITFTPGGSGQASIGMNPMFGFSGTVSLTTTIYNPSPPSAHASLSVSTVSSTSPYSILTVTDSNPSETGGFTVAVTGSSGSLIHSALVSVHITGTPSPPDFSLQVFPVKVTLEAGQSGDVQVLIYPATPFPTLSYNISLTSTITPTTNSLLVTFNPAMAGLNGSTMTIHSHFNTAPGAYIVKVTGTSGTHVHVAQVFLTVTAALLPPTIKLTPASGPIGTKVVVAGSAFQTNSQPGPNEVIVTFDDQNVGFTFVNSTGAFSFVFDVPVAQVGSHLVKANLELFTGNGFSFVTATAPFQVTFPPSSNQQSLTLDLQTGSLYFPGDTVTIFVQTNKNGIASTISDVQLNVTILTPAGVKIPLTFMSIDSGLYKAQWTISSKTVILGTYAVIASAHSVSLGNASNLRNFEIKLSWLQSNGNHLGQAVAGVSLLGLIGLTWRNGLFKKKEEEDGKSFDVTKLF